MFFRVTRAGRHQYVQIARSYRDGTTVKQQTLLSLGRLDALQASGQLGNSYALNAVKGSLRILLCIIWSSFPFLCN
jgi:hypothetical protein